MEDGSERIHTAVNPWDFLGVEERRQTSLLFNRVRYPAALDLIDALAWVPYRRDERGGIAPA